MSFCKSPIAGHDKRDLYDSLLQLPGYAVASGKRHFPVKVYPSTDTSVQMALCVSICHPHLCVLSLTATCSLYQLQAVTAELLETFDFALPKDQPHIKRAPAAVMVPIIEGKEELGPAMPLRVSLAQ